MREFVRACVRACVRAYVRAYVRVAGAYMCVHVRVCVSSTWTKPIALRYSLICR